MASWDGKSKWMCGAGGPTSSSLMTDLHNLMRAMGDFVITCSRELETGLNDEISLYPGDVRLSHLLNHILLH